MAAGRNTWNRLIARHGRTAELIRLGDTSDTTVSVKMMRRYAEEDKLEHEISQQDAWFVVSYTDLIATSWSGAPQKNDRVKIDDQYFTVFLVEPKSSHGEMVGYQLRCTGGG